MPLISMIWPRRLEILVPKFEEVEVTLALPEAMELQALRLEALETSVEEDTLQGEVLEPRETLQGWLTQND